MSSFSKPDPGATRKLTAEQWFDAVCAAFDIEQNGDGDQVYARCPVHEDKDAAMTINIGNDGYPVFYCQVCGGEDGWERALGAILIDRSVPVEALRPSMRPAPSSGAPTGRSATRAPDATATKPPSVHQLARWIEEMHPDRLYALADDRGLPLEVLCRAGVGWKVNQQGGRYVLPVEDVLTGALVDLKLYDPAASKNPLRYRKGGVARLYAPGGFSRTEAVILAEGEWDWMAGCALGLNVVGVTGGAGTVPSAELLEPLRGCPVVVLLFDNDDAGRQAGAFQDRLYSWGQSGRAGLVIFGVSRRWANETPVGRVVLPQTSRCHRSFVAGSSCHRRVVCDSTRRLEFGLRR